MKKKGRILSGSRPTGNMHIGHLMGILQNWAKLQKDYETFFEIADWHALTTYYQDTEKLKENIYSMVADWIASGINPEDATLFVQSDVKEHAELHLLFSMLITVQRLNRNPTVKEMAKSLHLPQNISYGLLGYPILQSADILVYRADIVPIGEDQLPHLELTREIARRFNNLYGKVFPEPKPILTSFPRIPGIDGKRMAKSLGNAIYIRDSAQEIEKKVMQCFTDPKKIRKSDPGHPDGCVVFTYHKIFNSDNVPEIQENCKNGKIGCVECKKNAAKKINEYLLPIREKREKLLAKKETLKEILMDGASKARNETRKTMTLVREAMKLW